MNNLLLAHIISLFLAAATFLAAGLLVFFKGQKKQTAVITNFLWSLSVVLWAFFMALGMIFGENVLFRIFWIFIMLIPITNVHFVTNWLELKKRDLFIKIGYISVAVLGFLYLAGINIEVVSIAYAQYYPKVKGILFFGSIIFLVYMFAQFYYLYLAYRNLTGIKKRQAGYFLWASFFGYFGGMANYLMAFGIYIPFYHPFASFLLILYPSIFIYAIFKYHIFDIILIIRKTLVYSIGIGLLAGFLGGMSFISDILAERVAGFKYLIIPFFTAVISFIVGTIFWEKSKEAEKLKHEFITVAAHKLRTPLTEIRWALGFLSDNLSESDKKTISNIRNSNDRLLELSDQLLAVSKDDEVYKYKIESSRLEKITGDILKDFESQIIKKGVKSDVHIAQNLPDVNIDKSRIAMVIQALLENAIAYTKNRISISIYNNDRVVFSIKDNGIGIAKEDQTYIFSKMYRSHEAFLSKTEGVGFSLYLAKNIIERHGGAIKVKSEGIGKGSEFIFELPV